MTTTTRRVAGLVLRVVVVGACLGFLAFRVRDLLAHPPADGWLAPHNLWFVAFAAPVFALTVVFMVAGWRTLLRHLGHPLPARALAGVLCLTQIAKYLPGNVGHHVGRVTLVHRSLGLPVSVGVISLLQESAVACLAALLVALASALLRPLPLGAAIGLQLDARWLLIGVVAVGLLALTVVDALRRSRPPTVGGAARGKLQWVLRAIPTWRATIAATPAYLMTYVVSGLALLLLSVPLLPDTMSAFLPLTSAYALSWMVGFLVPGAPGGLGVREATLVLLLDGIYPDGTVLAIALLSRLSVIAADVMIFIAGLVLQRTAGDADAPAQSN